MELNEKERLSLVFQLLILEKLYPDEQEYYANHRKAIENGYELHYTWITENLSSVLTAKKCEEVLDILDMYSSFLHSYRTISDPQNLDKLKLRFPGFSDKDEIMQMSYAGYFIEDLGRFTDIKESTKSNYKSVVPMLSRYKKMLAVWKDYSYEKRFALSEHELENILSQR